MPAVSFFMLDFDCERQAGLAFCVKGALKVLIAWRLLTSIWRLVSRDTQLSLAGLLLVAIAPRNSRGTVNIKHDFVS